MSRSKDKLIYSFFDQISILQYHLNRISINKIKIQEKCKIIIIF